ncbi:reverse transcriptase domain-containing protein [Tanacetum coccineum]
MQNQINSLKGDLKNEIQNTIKSQQAVMMNQQTTFQNNLQNMICGLFQNQASTLGTLPSNTIPNPKGEMKAITTRSGVAYEGPSIPTKPFPKKVVERETEETTDEEQTNFQGSTAQIPPPLPEKLGRSGKILIPCISRDRCIHASDLGASINLMPLSIWKKLSLPGLTPTWMTLELADRSITYPKGLSEDIFVKVRNFHFPTDFVVVDFEADPRVPLILGRSFLRTSRALIDVYEGKLVLRDGNEQITFHVDGTSKHPQKHVNESIKMVNDTCKDSFKMFTDEPALVCLPLAEDVNNEKEKQEVKNLAEPTAKRQSRITPCLKNFRVICKESIFHSNKTPQVSLVFAITSTLPSIEPKDSLIMGDEHLSIFSVEEIVPILRESKDTSGSDSKNVLPLCDDLSSIKIPRDDSVTFSNPLFEFDVNFNSSDINPLFDEVLEDIECKDSCDSNLDESTFLVTPLSDSNKDERLALGDDIEFLLHHDPSTPMKSIASILEGFIDDPPFEENDDLFDLECKTNDWKRILYDALIDEAECFDPGGDNDEIDAFLAIKVPTYIEEGYYDSEGDVIYLESLLSNDTIHNLSPEVFFDHEPQHDTFSPKSDPLHHEFTGELIAIPPRIVREHEDYINRMSLLCGNSSSRSPENSHTIIESLPTSTNLVEDSDSNREEIDIFSGPDDSIPPGIESDFDSEEDITDNLLNNDPIPEYERLTFDMEPNVLMINNVNEDECFDPGGGEINVEVNDSFTFVTRTFLSYLTYPDVSPLLSSTENEDTIFDPVTHRDGTLICLNVYLNINKIPIEIFSSTLSPKTNEFGDRVKLCDSVTKNKALRGRLSVRGNSRRTKNDRVKYEWDAKQGLVGNLKSSCTDNANITRNRPKPDKYRHGNKKSAKEPGVFINGQQKSTFGQSLVKHKIPKPLNFHKSPKC